MGRSKSTQSKSTQKSAKNRPAPRVRGVVRLPGWWQRLSHRLDLVGLLAERWAPTFHVGWLALTAVAFPLLLILLAFLLTSLR